MKIFFDTEFIENGTTIKPLSIGMVREDGAEYYAIIKDNIYLWELVDGWMKENVIRHFPDGDSPFLKNKGRNPKRYCRICR